MALRAVGRDETAPPPKSVAAAAKAGDQLELLVAMRDRIAEAVSKPDCPYRDLASLTKRLQDISRDISQLKAIQVEDLKSSGTTVDNTYDTSAI